MNNTCGNPCTNECHGHGSNALVIIIVLYILLAIIIGSWAY